MIVQAWTGKSKSIICKIAFHAQDRYSWHILLLMWALEGSNLVDKIFFSSHRQFNSIQLDTIVIQCPQDIWCHIRESHLIDFQIWHVRCCFCERISQASVTNIQVVCTVIRSYKQSFNRRILLTSVNYPFCQIIGDAVAIVESLVSNQSYGEIF